ELENKVAATVLTRDDRTCDVEAAECVSDGNETLRSHQPHARQSLLAFLLHTITVRIVEDLADDVSAVEGRIGHNADCCSRLAGQCDPVDSACDVGAIHELALADACADSEHQNNGSVIRGSERQPAPCELAANHRGLDWRTVHPGGSRNVPETGRE